MKPILEVVQVDVDGSFHCERMLCKHFSDNHAWHHHPEYELTWVISSEGTQFVGDSIKRYHPGDLVLLGPNLPHCWQDETYSAAPSLLVLQFAEDSFGAGFLCLDEAAPIKKLLSSAAVGLHFTGAPAAEAGRLLCDALECSGLERLLSLLKVLHLLAHGPTCSPLTTFEYKWVHRVNSNACKRIEMIERYVRENLAKEIRQADIAQVLNLSAPAFSRFFKSVTGNTFVAHVNQVRIHEACRRLASSSDTVTEIAMACGYNNLSNFNRQFLALRGINPSTYRQLARQKNNRQLHFPSSDRSQSAQQLYPKTAASEQPGRAMSSPASGRRGARSLETAHELTA